MPDRPADVALPFLLVAAFRGLVDRLHQELDEAGFPGLTATHGFAMQALGPGCTSTQLGQRLGVSKQAAGKTAQSLEALGLIARRPQERDAREKLLVPTARGSDMLQTSARIIAAIVRDWRTDAGDDAVDAMLTTLAGADHGRRAPTDISDWPWPS